jgi:hypothetical protein|tara:strand:+ start:2929 stop:3339 length:411 start_codon:yes stop_codon:yes gene_type:complete
MATTNATITLSSGDITGEPLNLSQTTPLTKAGTTTGLDQFTGVTRVVYASAQTATNIITAASYVDTTAAHKVYIRNVSTTPSDYIAVEVGSGNVSLGRLYGGDWAFLPWDGTNDIDIDTNAAMTVEYAIFSQSAAT